MWGWGAKKEVVLLLCGCARRVCVGKSSHPSIHPHMHAREEMNRYKCTTTNLEVQDVALVLDRVHDDGGDRDLALQVRHALDRQELVVVDVLGRDGPPHAREVAPALVVVGMVDERVVCRIVGAVSEPIDRISR